MNTEKVKKAIHTYGERQQPLFRCPGRQSSEQPEEEQKKGGGTMRNYTRSMDGPSSKTKYRWDAYLVPLGRDLTYNY